MKNSKDTMGNRNRDLPACSAVPQPTVPPRAPFCTGKFGNCVFKDRTPKKPKIYGKYYNVEVISNASVSTTIAIRRQEFPKAYLESREASDVPQTMKITKQIWWPK